MIALSLKLSWYNCEADRFRYTSYIDYGIRGLYNANIINEQIGELDKLTWGAVRVSSRVWTAAWSKTTAASWSTRPRQNDSVPPKQKATPTTTPLFTAQTSAAALKRKICELRICCFYLSSGDQQLQVGKADRKKYKFSVTPCIAYNLSLYANIPKIDLLPHQFRHTYREVHNILSHISG